MEDPSKALYHPLPGTDKLPSPPVEEFEALRQKRGASYHPRTRHLTADGRARYTNRLFLETSPYLLQHAHNPVNWFPWGEEAFALSRQLNRPLMVSIGYATCHWCHVMEEESFEDEEIARYLNDNFIAVKVDREERPDVDSVYMSAVQAMNGQGGWPLNVWLTPDRRPFYGGTYFPPRNHSRGIGFPALLRLVKEAYEHEPEKIEEAGRQLTRAIGERLAPAAGDSLPPPHTVDRLMAPYKERFDPVHGSLLGAPKFPSTLPLRLLYRHYLHTGDREVLEMAVFTLRRMAAGGIYDQVGGGFHRYTVDEGWLVPHFEKMLYDNALLCLSYLEGYQLTKEEEFARVAREILRYLQRDMGAPGGAFYCATDADSPTPSGKREEGYFFTWTPAELEEVLGEEQARVVSLVFGVSGEGNFEGRNILNIPRHLHEVASSLSLDEMLLRYLVEEAKELLYRARERRAKPLRDEKILSSWNGLALRAFARGGFVLKDEEALAQARKTAHFLMEHLTMGERLAHSYQEGEAKVAGFLDDYAFFIAGLLDLFEATGETPWLKKALELEALLEKEFADLSGGYFLTGTAHERLIAREKPGYDGAVPSGNSVMASNLFRLHGITGDPRFKSRAERSLAAFSKVIQASPAAATEMLLSLYYLQNPAVQLTIIAPAGRREAADLLLDKVRGELVPTMSLVVLCDGEEADKARPYTSLAENRHADGEKAVAYLCREGSCFAPTSDPDELARAVKEAAGHAPLARR